MSNATVTPTARRNAGPARVRREPLSATVKAVLVGTVVGFFVVAAITGGTALAMGAGVPGALAVAVFTGVWGGPGFGGMMGFVLQQARDERAAASRS